MEPRECPFCLCFPCRGERSIRKIYTTGGAGISIALGEFVLHLHPESRLDIELPGCPALTDNHLKPYTGGDNTRSGV